MLQNNIYAYLFSGYFFQNPAIKAAFGEEKRPINLFLF